LKTKLKFTCKQIRTYYNKYYSPGLTLKKGVYFNDEDRVKGPTLRKGDYVYLFLRNLHLKQPSAKLDFKKYRLFRVTKKVATSNFKLNLPTIMKVRTKVFYVSLLELVPRKVLLEKKIKVEVDEEEFDIKEVLDLRYKGRTLYYLVK